MDKFIEIQNCIINTKFITSIDIGNLIITLCQSLREGGDFIEKRFYFGSRDKAEAEFQRLKKELLCEK